MELGFVEEARSILDGRFAARERAITGSRRVIRSSANAIRALHRGESELAQGLIAEAGALLAGILTVLGEHPELIHVGYTHDAAKEYAEARVTAALFRGDEIPGFADLGIDPVPYLHGMGEAVGEMRRRMLDLLRSGDIPAAEQAMEVMDEIVDLLAEIDYPDGMTNGLRRTTDIARSLVERSRADLTATVTQERLRQDLSRS